MGGVALFLICWTLSLRRHAPPAAAVTGAEAAELQPAGSRHEAPTAARNFSFQFIAKLSRRFLSGAEKNSEQSGGDAKESGFLATYI